MESTFIFASVISEEEWSSINPTIGKRLEKFVQDKFEELITAKALLETNRSNAEKALSELKIQYETLVQEKNELQTKLESAQVTLSEYETNYTTIKNDLIKLQATCNRLESENAEFRHQRNLAIDERDENLKMLQRRTNEVERLQSDLDTITKQLESAINAKCEALAKSDEVESIKLRLEYREKRIDQERQLLNSQVESLTEDLNKKTEELLNMRRDNTSRCIQLETKLTEKTQELIVANEQIKALTELNNNLTAKNEELLQKLLDQRDADSKMNESYLHEIEAKTKLSNAYKSMFEESQQHAEGLKEALAEVQQLLKNATEQYGELETKHKETELANEEILAKKNECIAMLKKELEIAKEMMEQCKHEQLQKDIESLSPTAAPAAGLFKSGTTATELYYQYTNANLRVADLEKENAQLKNYINTIVHEIEEKGPLIRKLREDYTNAIDANELLKNNNEQLTNEIQQLREANAEAIRLEESISRENARYKKEITDLSRQVCHLLQEIEHARIGGGGSSSSTDLDTNDSICSADIITKKLVTFNDIVELQKNNQKLLAVVRELTERQEEMEAFDPSVLADMKMKLENLKESHQELLNERDRQNKMMATLSNQRDMYKNLYTQAIKAAGEELPPNHDISSDKIQNDYSGDSTTTTTTNTTITSNEKIQDLLNVIEDYKKKIEQLKNDNETYRKEKTANEKILLEQMETIRIENIDLIKQNCKLSSQLENCEEKFKVSQNNSEIYKKQITALEKQNKIYNDTIIKHEEAVAYLKEETMQSQTRLSKAEVILGNLQKENALLKDAESRLLRERDNLKRELHTQNMIQSNIELIKATLERTDAESKLRLEARLDEAHRECSALRRRLQEEQDRFRQLTEHLEQQTQNAKQRMEEEQQEAEKLRNDLATTRNELIEKTNQIDELTKKMKTSIILSETQQSQHDNVQRIVQLEQQLNDCKAEIELLNTKLKTAKEASDQYYNVATNSENQLKLLMEQQEQYKKEMEQAKDSIKQLQERCSELEGELSIHMDDQDINNIGKSKSHQLQEELNIATMDLQTAKQQLENILSENKSLIDNLKAVENKYAREVMLHSADLQLLTDMKSELEQLRSELNDIKQARDCAINELQESKISWENQEKLLQNERQELEERFKHMDEQNNLLLDQIQALNTQLSLLQTQQISTTSGEQSTVSSDTSFNKSFSEDDMKSSEQLLTIIKYLRQEKDIAVSKCEIMDAEYQRLKSQSEILTKQLNEAKTIIENERQKSEISVVSTAKHAEVLRKIETLNAITDSNRALRQERDELKKQIDEMKQSLTKLENELQPLQEKNRELTIKAEAMQTENISLRGECTRWRQRAQMLIEKSNRTSPEDWKKLQNERETLAKQITIERSNIVKLNDEINNLKQEKIKTDEQLKNFKQQTTQQQDELTRQRDDLTNLQQQVQQLTQQLEQTQETNKRILEENRILTEDTAGKDFNITELKNNLTQIRKIAKKYKIQCEDQIKELKTLKEENEIKESEQNLTKERQMQEQRNELQERIAQLEQTSRESLEKLNQEIQRLNEENENYKKEVETLRQGALEREERFKNLFKNAKDRIVTLTEQNNTLKAQIDNREKSDDNDNDGTNSSGNNAAGTSGTDTIANNSDRTELIIKIDTLENEKAAILAEKRQENEKYESEIESLMQKVTQLQRQLGQQSSRPTTSSTTTDKTPTEPPPTANIKPMATNTQTQSVPIQPWRSAGETPLASIRPMSAQSRTTVAVLPTSQTPSSAAVMILPQQQVHTTGSGNTSNSTTEVLSNSPTSSHTTEYVPATSSATTATTGGDTNSNSGPRQIVVPPTQSTQDTEEDDDNNMQQSQQSTTQQQQSTTQQQQSSQPQQQSQQQQPQLQPQQQSQQQQQSPQQPQQQQAPPQQQQAVALVLPRIETTPGSGGSNTEQSTSSSNSSNTVTTSQASSLKRQRESDTDQNDEQSSSTSTTGMNLKIQQQSKRSRVQQSSSGTTVSDSGLEVEYQVPTSSQRDHDDDHVIVLESDDEGGPDEGEGADDEPDDADTEGYDMETMEQDNYEDADCQDVEDDDEGGNEVEVIEDSSEVPNQSERSTQQGNSQEENTEQTQPEATSSGSDGGSGGQQSGVFLSQASTSVSMTMPSFSRTRSVAPLPSNRQQQQQQQQQQHSHLLLSHGLEEGGDDGIVPSTPTLFVPRRSDGFGEAVSSPHVPTSGRFTFNESMPQNTAGSSGEVVPEQTIETAANIDENSTGRSVPSTPLQASPQESMPGPDEQQGTSQTTQSDAELPTITVSDEQQTAEGSSEECMGPPNVAAGTSTDGNQSTDQLEESEGYDGVTSEGEKAPNTDDGEEEGREAEASPSTNTRSRASRGQLVARRSVRQASIRGSGGGITRSGPTPIVWVGGDQRNHRHQAESGSPVRGGRGNVQMNYSPRSARRARGRSQRPYGRY